MMKIKIDSWELKNLFEENKPVFDMVKTISERQAKVQLGYTALTDYELDEKGKAKGWQNFEGFVNSPDDVPIELLNVIKWEYQPQLKFVNDDGVSISAKGVVDAMRLHQVHLPNNLLMNFSQVQAVENPCTESLQKEYLNEGWRIIAVCPQAGQRRPDYILGKV